MGIFRDDEFFQDEFFDDGGVVEVPNSVLLSSLDAETIAETYGVSVEDVFVARQELFAQAAPSASPSGRWEAPRPSSRRPRARPSSSRPRSRPRRPRVIVPPRRRVDRRSRSNRPATGAFRTRPRRR